jgi:hypothetical protein
MYILAGVAKLEYAAGLGPVGGNTVGVRVPPPALRDDSWLAAWRSPVLRSQCCGKVRCIDASILKPTTDM